MLAIVAERWVTQVMGQTSDFNQIHANLAATPQKLLCSVETNRYGFRDLSDFERVCKSVPKEIGLMPGKELCLAD